MGSLFDLILRGKNIIEFLDRNQHLDLNIAYAFELPLHLGCRFSDEKSVEGLLAAGANPELFCGYGHNALQCIADADDLSTKVLSWLTRGYKQRGELAKYINSPDQSQGRRVTHYVARSRSQRPEVVYALNETGADWTLKDHEGNTPFELAAKNDHWIIASLLATSQWDMSDEAIKGVAVNVNSISACVWSKVSSQNVSGKSAH